MRRISGITFAAICLLVLTVVAWQFRFVQTGPPLGGFGETLSFTKRDRNDPSPHVEKLFGPMPNARFLRVAADARWTDALQGEKYAWAMARGLIFGRAPDGSNRFPPDHALFGALGTREWHTEEAVFELPPDMGNVGFAFEHIGNGGTLEVSNVRISVVEQRPWFMAATLTLILLWIAWAAWIIAPHLDRLRWPRAILAGATLIGAFWFLVFPQPRFSARPLIGSFQLGPEIAPAAVTQTPPALAPTPPPPPIQNPAPPVPPPAVVAVESVSPSETAPVKRETRTFDKTIRDLRNRFNFLHLVAFGAFGLAFFSFGSLRFWPLAAIVVFASEALPNHQFNQPWDWGDIGDLAMDSLGLLLAGFLIISAKKLFLKRRTEATSSNPEEQAS